MSNFVPELNQKDMDELIASFLSKGTSPEEEQQLLNWITTNSDNREYYGQMYRAWLSSAQSGRLESLSDERALKKVRQKAFESPVTVGKRQQGRKAQNIMLSILKYAAAVAVLVISTYALTRHYLTQHLESQIAGMTYEAHYGSRAYTTLPDGSKVWLNSGSKLTVLPGYNLNERTVELSGEAYFNVATNPQKPFIVKAGELSIRATGTAFNVKAYPEEEQITATLVEGIVFIEGVDPHETEFKMQMKPNQTVNYRRHPAMENSVAPKDNPDGSPLPKPEKPIDPPALLSETISQAKTETLTSWMKDRWIIDNEEFGRLAVQLERRYNVEIRFESEELKRYRFTGTIERETVEQMFDAFRYSIPLKYTIDKGIVTLSSDEKLKKQYEKAWKTN